MYRRDFLSGLAVLFIPKSGETDGFDWCSLFNEQTLTEMIVNSKHLISPNIKIHYEYTDKKHMIFRIDNRTYKKEYFVHDTKIIETNYFWVPSYQIKGRTTKEKYQTVLNDIDKMIKTAKTEYKGKDYILHLFIVEEDNMMGICTYERK